MFLLSLVLKFPVCPPLNHIEGAKGITKGLTLANPNVLSCCCLEHEFFEEWLFTRSICFYLKSWLVLLQQPERLTLVLLLKNMGYYILHKYLISSAFLDPFKSKLDINLCWWKFLLLRILLANGLETCFQNAHLQKLLLANSIWLAVLQHSL